MTTVIYMEFDGTTHSLDVLPGTSVMKAAIQNDISGILADCGGACACATCHVYIDDPWRGRIPSPSQMELDMLECASDMSPASRLACQISITDDLDGLVVRLPETQS